MFINVLLEFVVVYKRTFELKRCLVSYLPIELLFTKILLELLIVYKNTFRRICCLPRY